MVSVSAGVVYCLVLFIFCRSHEGFVKLKVFFSLLSLLPLIRHTVIYILNAISPSKTRHTVITILQFLFQCLVIIFLDFKFSPCFESRMFAFGLFPVVCS
jgi:hypothetical protein